MLLLLELKLSLALLLLLPPQHLLLLPSWMYHEERLPVGRYLGDVGQLVLDRAVHEERRPRPVHRPAVKF